MKTHEKHCTANPNRECRFCKIVGIKNDKERLKQIVVDAIQDFDEMGFDEQIDRAVTIQNDISVKLLKESHGCPACVLAAVRQTKDSELIQFDYKAAKEEFWLHNDQRPHYDDDW